MNAWQEVKCPLCKKVLFEALGLSAHMVIRIHCRCKRVLEIREGWHVAIIQERRHHIAPELLSTQL